ncbi:BQ5605_C026g10259 [Microbotryum silenes-dioicae]|uniref:BQ5605_C026g10259 protein n=1 Tax=Microbotryum silenes-dioicae TaxID=796604 RepID=A0A2X0N972_9BASI|nr:BQ5605_C026g10259 [Microbotryum silenes-dioicae]
MYGCQQQAKMLRSLHEEMTQFISLRKARGDPHAGGYSNVSSGQALARAFEAGVFDDKQNGFFGLLTDGALVKENREGSFWIWTVTLYNIPIESGRYRRNNTYVLVIAPCATTTTDFDSFAFIILKRFKEAARGIWIFDSIDHTWFLWRGYILFFLAELMGQAKQSGFVMSRGTFPCNNCEMPSATKPNGAGHYIVEDGQATYRGDRCVGRKKAAEEDTGEDDGGDNSDGDGDNDDHDGDGDGNERPQKRQKAVPPSTARKQVNAHRAIRGYYPYNGAPRPRLRTLARYKAQISKAFNLTLSERASKKILEGLKTVGPLLRLCSASYKALVWLGDILENLRAQYRTELVAFLKANPGFKVHGKRISFTRRAKPKENNSGGRNGGARSSQGEQVRLVFVFRAADTDACTPVQQGRFDPEETEMCEEEQGSEGEKERAGTDYDDEYSATARLAEQTYPTLPNARLCWLGDTGANDLSCDLQRLLNSATELCRYDKTFLSTQKHVHPHIKKFAQDLAKLQLSAETNGLNQHDLDNGGAQIGHGKLGLTELAETREDLANWPNWSIWDVVTRLWNCIAAIARDEFAHVRRKGKATGRNGDNGQTLTKVKVGYIFRAAMVPTVQDLMKMVEQALDEHKKETRGEVESELATTSSNVITDDATLQQLASATPDQINKTIATPLAKKHGRGNLPKHAKHASPKTVATQPVSKTLGRLRVPTSDTEYYGQSH